MQGARPARRELRVENRASEDRRVENQAPGEDLRDPIPGLHTKVDKPMMGVENQIPGEDLSVPGTYLREQLQHLT